MSHGQQAATYALVALRTHGCVGAREWRGMVQCGGEVWVVEREYEKVMVMYVFGSGVEVLLVAVVANNQECLGER
jgi:hypothetical protein